MLLADEVDHSQAVLASRSTQASAQLLGKHGSPMRSGGRSNTQIDIWHVNPLPQDLDREDAPDTSGL